MNRATKAVAGVAGIAVAALAAEQVAARRTRNRTDPDTDPLLRLPTGVVHHRISSHDGGELHAVERGEGRPLVLLHGVTLAAPVWSPQLHGLAGTPGHPGFRVIAVDLRGHGSSTVGSDGWGMAPLAHDLATVLTQLDLRRAIVAGHSMGGMTTMRFCTDFPDVLAERVAGVVFVATAAATPLHPFLLSRVTTLGARIIDRLDHGKPYPAMRFSGGDVSLLMCRLAFGKDPSAAAVEQVRACVEAMDVESLQRSWVGLLDHDVRDTLGSVAVPAEIVVGSRDLLTPPAAARSIAGLLPGAGFHLLHGAGHQLMQERPAELASIIRDLAARVDVAVPAAG